ncbi:hypothetical protein EDD86DRAFT_250134 [Gorgonomyces haynaldii]|nr:hypothetical protein EDD86DRAFT_250134 [Gorgonomyces haynaldii]
MSEDPLVVVQPRGLDRFKKAVSRVVAVNVMKVRRPPPGSIPGVDLDYPPPHIGKVHEQVQIQVTDFDSDDISVKILNNDSLAAFLDQERPQHSKVRWINCSHISFDVIKILGKKYSLHPLAVEDLFHIPQRVKVDLYEEHVYASMILPTISKDENIDESKFYLFQGHQSLLMKSGFPEKESAYLYRPNLVMEQCAFFLLNNGVVLSIFQNGGGLCVESINKRLTETPKKHSLMRRYSDPSFMLYAFIDVIVDHYLLILDFYQEQLAYVQDKIIAKPKVYLTRALHMMNKELVLLKSVIGPADYALDTLISSRDYEDFSGSRSSLTAPYQISKLTATYVRDVKDHIQFFVGNLEEYEQLIQGMTFNSITHSTNESMKILAVTSLIFLPLTLLCGIYGMNFEYFPELHFEMGIIYFWILASVIIVILIFISWRMKWLSINH